MPFPYVLPTTSNVYFTDAYRSYTHPSLPLSATIARGALRGALKKHKRLPQPSQTANLPTVQAALHGYIPYLFALDAGLSGGKVGGEEVDLILVKEVQVEWRATLTSSQPARVRLKSLESELFFTLVTLAHLYSLLGRSQLHMLYNHTSSAPESRAKAIVCATRHFLDANSIFSYLTNRASQLELVLGAVDISIPVLSALAELSLAEGTLATVLKDDPYPLLRFEDSDPHSKDWMFKSVEIPKVRAHLLARLCLAAAENASKAQVSLASAEKVEESLIRYTQDLQRAARGKACRFLGIDAELSARTGEGIAWLYGAKKELGFMVSAEYDKGRQSRLGRLKSEWAEKKEDRRAARSQTWGAEAGKIEELKVVEMLTKKWQKSNNTACLAFR